MKIWIDGDGCPVRKETVRVGTRRGIEVVIVVDINHRIEEKGASIMVVDQGPDSVDMAIAGNAQHGDLVITGDMGLASLIIGKKAYVLDIYGTEIGTHNIDMRLFERHMKREIRMSGGRHKGPKSRGKEANAIFEKALDQLLDRIGGSH